MKVVGRIETKTPANIEFTGVMKWSKTLSVTLDSHSSNLLLEDLKRINDY